MKKRYWLTERFATLTVGCFLFSLCLALKAEAVAPVITASDGILYQDGKPCFLVGVWGGLPYVGGFSVHPQVAARLEPVPGRTGKGLKISFPPVGKPGGSSLWVDFDGFDSRICFDTKARFLKLWVKGDGSSNAIIFKVENYDGRTIACAHLGEFSLSNTNWTQFSFPLEKHYSVLAQANAAALILPHDKVTKEVARDGLSFVIDEISIEGPEGEKLLYDFDGKMAAVSRLKLYRPGKEKFKEDPVYKAIWDDPLYQEVSWTNFQIIGMSTYHQEGTGANGTILSKGDLTGQGYFYEQLAGMPVAPGFYFTFGAYNGGQGAEDWAKNSGLPPTVLRRCPNGSPGGGFDAICFEDPTGNKIHRELWQNGVRNILEHKGNPYAYELVNENSGYYFCACSQNKNTFIERLRVKYKDIAALNKTWGTDYQSFDAILAGIPELGNGSTKIKGLTVEWNKFMEDRYVETLREGGRWIHEVEDEFGHPHGLIGQMGDAGWDFYGSGGADMYKMSKGLDCIQTEAGVGFGGGSYSGEVNPLTLVMAGRGNYHHQMASDLADAACPDKPIISTENYVIRYRGEQREPTTKADIITSLWEEFLRGASATHTYAWQSHYATREEALAEGARNQRLLSPYLYPRESLNGYKEVQEEIGRVADIVMKRPRLGRNAELGVLFSRPTARYLIGVPSYVPDWKKKHPFYRSHEAVYGYLLGSHIPMKYLYEEQLPEGVAGKYRIMIAPHSDNIYPETMKYLTEYAKQGGTLICFGDALLFDEYGNKRYGKESGDLLGLARNGITNIIEETVLLKDGGRVKVACKREVTPGTAEALVKFPERGTPFITLNKVGKGSVYYVNADMSELGEMAGPLLDYLTAQVQLNASLEITDMNGARPGDIEANVIPKGKETVVFLVNWKAYLDRVVKVKFREVSDNDKYYLADIAKDSLYVRNGREQFRGSELKEGINLLLPNQERVVLLVTGNKYTASNKPMEILTDESARELDKKIRKELEETLAKEASVRARQREIMFGLIGHGDYDKIRQCIQSAAGDTLQEIKLLRTNSSCDIRVYGLREGADSVLTYVLTYKEGLKAEEIDGIQNKVIEALVEKFKAQMIKGQSREEFLKSQSYTGLGHCEALDIRKQAIMGLADEKADDQKGGLFDEGRNLVGFPVGSQKFAGVPFEIIDPAKNNGLACIVLRGQGKPYFPEKAEGILVGRKAKNIYLLHTAGYCSGNVVVYRLRLNYSDGTSNDVDIKAGSELKDWFNKPQACMLSNAKLAWQGKAQEKRRTAADGEEKTTEHDVVIYCARLANPHPDKEIKTMDIISANNTAVPGIFAITVEDN